MVYSPGQAPVGTDFDFWKSKNEKDFENAKTQDYDIGRRINMLEETWQEKMNKEAYRHMHRENQKHEVNEEG
jgi:hypothetical protein